jgi:hypothetical protein
LENSVRSNIWITAIGMLFVVAMLVLGLTRPKYIGRRFKVDRDTEYVKEKLWSYSGGFKIGLGDFLKLDGDASLFDLKGDTIYYKTKPMARIVRLNKHLFLMKIESLKSGEEGAYINVEERLQ